MPYNDKVKEFAYKLDPECWKSYSGKSKAFKQQMDARRQNSLDGAQQLFDREAQQRDNSQTVLKQTDRMVVFKRDILVPNPSNRYENQRFGVNLVDRLFEGETYADGFYRLKVEGNSILLTEIEEYLFGRRTYRRDVEVEALKKKYNL